MLIYDLYFIVVNHTLLLLPMIDLSYSIFLENKK